MTVFGKAAPLTRVIKSKLNPNLTMPPSFRDKCSVHFSKSMCMIYGYLNLKDNSWYSILDAYVSLNGPNSYYYR